MKTENKSQFIPYVKIEGRMVGITYNRRSGRDPVINIVEQHEPIIKNNSFKDVKNATLSRLDENNFKNVHEAIIFIQENCLRLFNTLEK